MSLPFTHRITTTDACLIDSHYFIQHFRIFFITPHITFICCSVKLNPLAWVGLTSLLLGSIFPLLAQCAIPADNNTGPRIAYLYFANICGSNTGIIVTGFFLLDHVSMAQLSVYLACAGYYLQTAFYVFVVTPRK